MMRLIQNSFLVFAACRPLQDLPDVAIIGATADEEVALKIELEQMDEALLNGVELRKIVVKDGVEGDDLAGRYSFYSKKVVVVRHHFLGAMREALRHEVCHAVDHQAGRVSEEQPLLESAMGLIRQQSENDRYDSNDGKKRLAEGFARLCSMGPGGVDALRESATDPNVARAADWLDVYYEGPSTVLEPWIVLKDTKAPSKILLHQNQGLSLMYPDGEFLHFDERGAPISAAARSDEYVPDFGTDISAFVEHAYFGGEPHLIGRAASGTFVAFITPTGSNDIHLFVQEPRDMWAWEGVVEPNIGPVESPLGGLFMEVFNGVVTIARMDGDTLRVDRVY